MKARKMRAAEYSSHQESLSAALAGRQFCVEDEAGRIVVRLVTWSQACEAVEAEAEHA